MSEFPPTRWERWRSEHDGYQAHFADLIEQHVDIDGEARLADVLVPRGATILDAGSGMGRVAGALAARGHRVTAVEKDPVLVADSRRRYPDVPAVESDILGLSRTLLSGAGVPSTYDLVTVVGNVMILLADGTEQRALSTLAGLLAPDGRLLVGFSQRGGPVRGAVYPYAAFEQHARAVGLEVQSRFGSYDLGPADDEYVVAVLVTA